MYSIMSSENKHHNPNPMEKSVLRGKFIAIQSCLSKQEKSQINKATRERRTNKIQRQQKENIIKIRGKINKTELKKTIAKIKLRAGSKR